MIIKSYELKYLLSINPVNNKHLSIQILENSLKNAVTK